VADRPPTSADIRSALLLRYPAQSHALLWEVANGTGSNSRTFADAVAFGLWPSHGHEIEGIEIKVSRGDWLREKAKPDKSQPVFRYCRRWWLACPKGMVAPDELPPTWGLLELTGAVLRVKVKAPALEPERVSLGFVAAMLRRHAGVDSEMSTNEVERQVRERVAAIKDQLEKRAQQQLAYRQRNAEEGIALLDRVAAETGVDFRTHMPDGLLAVVRLAMAIKGERAWQSKVATLRNTARDLIESIEAIPGIADALGDDQP
jgi:hypothetical protein